MSEISFTKTDDEAMKSVVKLQDNDPSRSDNPLHLGNHGSLCLHAEKVQEVQGGDDIKGRVSEG